MKIYIYNQFRKLTFTVSEFIFKIIYQIFEGIRGVSSEWAYTPDDLRQRRHIAHLMNMA